MTRNTEPTTTTRPSSTTSAPAGDPRARFRELPAPVLLEDTTSAQDVPPGPDPGPSQDPNRTAAVHYPL